MSRVFLRVLVGIGAALVVYGLIAYLLFLGLNQVRLLEFRERLPFALVAWLREAPREHVLVLGSFLQGPEALQFDAPDALNLTRLQAERLDHGQIVRVGGTLQDEFLARLDSRHWVRFRWHDPLRQSVLWTTRVIAAELQGLSGSARDHRLAAWAQRSGLRLEGVLPVSAPEVTEALRMKLGEAGHVFLDDVLGRPHALWLLAGEEVLLFSGLPRFSFWSGWVVSALMLVGILALAAALYLLMERLDRRLRKLETVARRIARGELDARVDDSRFDAIGRLGQVFNRMADHIQRLVEVQREMIHAVSHELRTPVARIRFGVQMIEDIVSDPAAHKQLKGIDSDIQELNELIDEILTYARLEQGGPILDFQDVNLEDIVLQVVEEQQRIKPDRQLQAEFAGESGRWRISQAEPRYIHRSLQNLVGNALRYANSRVLVRCNFGEETCRIDVEDDGPGIPEDQWERVFTPFSRLDDSRTRSSGGFGLGLSIVRRILYWHGGQAFVARSELGGAKFSLVWPRLQAKEPG